MSRFGSPLAQAFDRLGPRQVHGISATLLPYTEGGDPDWSAFESLVARTRAAGLDVAVNMDTGFGDLLSPQERETALDVTRSALGAGVPFYAGAYPGDPADPLPGYRDALAAIAARGATPVVVQSTAMHAMPGPEKAAFYAKLLADVERALAFELGAVFAPHGEIWDDATFEAMLEIPSLAGSKHSSLDRTVELRRLAARDALRPDFRVYTGNDLAIDMVAYGSDYLLGLSTFAPEAFGARDRALAAGEAEFLARNDALQHLGNVGFRAPVPAYKHAAALYLHLTGRLDAAEIHPRATRRPQSDRVLLYDCARRVGDLPDPEAAWRERVEPYL